MKTTRRALLALLALPLFRRMTPAMPATSAVSSASPALAAIRWLPPDPSPLRITEIVQRRRIDGIFIQEITARNGDTRIEFSTTSNVLFEVGQNLSVALEQKPDADHVRFHYELRPCRHALCLPT